MNALKEPGGKGSLLRCVLCLVAVRLKSGLQKGVSQAWQACFCSDTEVSACHREAAKAAEAISAT